MATGVVQRVLRQPKLLKHLQSSLVKANQITCQANHHHEDSNRITTSDPSTSAFSPCVTKGSYVSCVLTDEYAVRQAQALLHDNYKERGWEPWERSNPTGFQIKKNLASNYVTDKFDDNSVIWVGTFHSDRLVTGIRLNFRTTANPLLDIEGYQSAYEPSLQTALRQSNVAEISRFVTMPNYRSSGVGSYSLMVLFMILSKYNHKAVFTSQLDFFGKYGIGSLLDRGFDYDDGVKTNAWFYSQDDIENILKLLGRKIEM